MIKHCERLSKCSHYGTFKSTAHSVYQQAKAITACMDFYYWLYALMTSNLSPAPYFMQLEGTKPPFIPHTFIVTATLFTCWSKYLLSISNFVVMDCMGLCSFCLWMRGVCMCICILLSRAVIICCVSSPEEHKESQVKLNTSAWLWNRKRGNSKHRRNTTKCHAGLVRIRPLLFTDNEYWPCYFRYWCEANTGTAWKVITERKSWSATARPCTAIIKG